MKFTEKLNTAIQKNNSLVCVGLDPDPKRMPDSISVSDFNREIIEATSDTVCAYKPNFAFYEALGDEGWAALNETLKHIPGNIPVIADAKRNAALLALLAEDVDQVHEGVAERGRTARRI